jgi:hypothetical protein
VTAPPRAGGEPRNILRLFLASIGAELSDTFAVSLQPAHEAYMSMQSARSSLSHHGRRSGVLRSSLLILALAMGACSSDDAAPTAPDPVDLDLGQTSLTIVRGVGAQTRQLAPTVTGSSNQAVTYEIGDARIATVSSTGLITAVGDGSTFVTVRSAADPSKNRSVVVNVVSTIVTVSPAAAFSWVGGPTRTVAATVQNNPNTAVTWTSSNPAVATVSATGVVTPVSAGTTTITAASQGDPTKQAATTFTVDPAAITTATLLTSGTPVTGLGAAAGVDRYFRIVVPTGATSLTVTLSGATSDIDLFVTAAALPTVSYAATPGAPTRCFAATASGNETCTIANPQSRIYYILIDAYEAYSNVTITATIAP